MSMRLIRLQGRASLMSKSLTCFASMKNDQLDTSNMVTYLLRTQSATEDVATLHSAVRKLKDVHLISGTLGAGKSTFWYAFPAVCPQRFWTIASIRPGRLSCSRAYIRYACDDEELAVPSPTYTLLNTYEDEIVEGPPIHHLDLYRLNSTAGQHRLQLQELWLTGATLIEWPERLRDKPAAYFTTQISTFPQVGPCMHAALLCSHGEWAAHRECG
jgi:tRNA A37 threonylcarbamoyladenosine biosynthesis protein TsaE